MLKYLVSNNVWLTARNNKPPILFFIIFKKGTPNWKWDLLWQLRDQTDSGSNSTENALYRLFFIVIRLLEKPLSEWLEILEGTSLPFSPVQTMEQVFHDPQVLHNHLLLEMQHKSTGTVRVPGDKLMLSSVSLLSTACKTHSNC